ncbi:MAG: SGNH/GDSL hydrolase family protein [Bacteroidota bacterium]
MRIPYMLSAVLAIPLLPLMYLQGKRIRARVPELPEAKVPQGRIEEGSAPPLRLLTIGESTIAGVGADLHENAITGSLAKQLAKQTGQQLEWRVYARSGYTAKRVTYKILPKIEEKEVDLIVIGLGGNDAFTLNRPWQWRRDICLLIEQLQTQFPATPIFFTNMPPIHEFPAFTWLIKRVVGGLVRTLGRELEQLVQDYDQVYYSSEVIHFETWQDRYQVSGPVSDFFSDGVHPAPITYQLWGQDMASFILRQIKL